MTGGPIVLSEGDWAGDNEKKSQNPRGVARFSREIKQRMGSSVLVEDQQGDLRVPGDSDPPADSEDEPKIE